MFLGMEVFSADREEEDIGDRFSTKKRRVRDEGAAASSTLDEEEGAAAGSISISPKTLLDLPPEVIRCVLWYLEKLPQNARNLSITCRTLCGKVRDARPSVQVYFSQIETLTLFT